MSDIPVCIDISHHQGPGIDWDEVKAAGVLGVIHKATEGTSFIDDMRAENLAAAKQAGLGISTYFWLKPGDGREQADFYLSVIDPIKGERVCIDYEENGCSLQTLEDATAALLDYGLDLQVCVYSGHLAKEVLGNNCNEFLRDNTSLWLAQYTNDESSISWAQATWPEWSLWQYSESGTIPGIDDAYVDLNNFNGSPENFLKWISPAGGAPPEPPMPPLPPVSPDIVDVAITAPDGVGVRISVNGASVRGRRLRRLLRAVKRGPDVLR